MTILILGKIKIVIISLVFIITLFHNLGLSAQDRERRKTQFLILKTGMGIPYSFYGANLEFGINRFGFSIGGGFMPSQTISGRLINSSYNFSGGLQYYLPKLAYHVPVRPRVGLHVGWLNNYYDLRIEDKPYNPIVYGTALIVGFEYSKKFFFLNFDISYDPGIATFDKKRHPYYNDRMYFNYSLGAGVNLVPFVQSLDFKKKKKYYRSLEDNGIKAPKLAKKDSVINKGLCGKITVYQRIDEDKYIFVKVNLDSLKTNLQYNRMELGLAESRVISYIENLSEVNQSFCCSNDNLPANEIRKGYQLRYVAVSGNAVVISNNKKYYSGSNENFRISVKLKDLKFVNENDPEAEDIYIDEIIIYDVGNYDYCEF